MNDVLIVEDELGVREFLRHALRWAAIPYRVATSGTSALRLASVCWPDVILLDLTLPGRLDGWQVWEALAAAAAGRPLQVVIFGGEINATDCDQALRRGAYRILRKPVLPEALVATLRQALGQIRPD